jgi:hypothetical protein
MAKKPVHKKSVVRHAAPVAPKLSSSSDDVTKQPLALPIIIAFVLFAGWFLYSQYMTYTSFGGGQSYFDIPRQENNKPATIVTYALPSATQGKEYKMSVVASDPDANERMTMIIAGLPLGMKQGKCVEADLHSSDALRKITCDIEGTPNQAGDFSLLVSVTDSANHQTRNEMPLHVINAE